MNYETEEVQEVECLGICEEYVYDIGMRESPHTFFANDVLVHNSVFLNYGEILKSRGFDLSDKKRCVESCLEMDKEVDSTIKENCDNISMNIMNTDNMYNFESEEVISRILITSKKKYMARVIYDKTTGQYTDDNFTIKGMEFKKSNLSENIKSFLKETTIKIMDGLNEENTMSLLRSKFNELLSLPISDIAFVQGVKNIDKYERQCNIDIKDSKTAIAEFVKGCPYHVAGAIAMNALIDFDPKLRSMNKISEGEKGQIVFVCPTNILKVKAITLSPNADWNPVLFEYFKLDVEYIFQRLIIGPLQPTFDAVGFKVTMQDILGFKFLDSENKFIQPCLF